MQGKEILGTLSIDGVNHLYETWNTIPNNIYIKDKDLLYVWVNTAYMKFLGIKDPLDAVIKSDSDFFSQEYAELSKEKDQKIISSGKPSDIELEKVTCRDGLTRTFIVTRTPIINKGEVVGLLGIWSNIPNIPQASVKSDQSEQLEKEKSFFEDLFENSTAMTAITDPDGIIIKVNKKALDLFFNTNKTQETIEGKNILDFVYKDDKGMALRLWKQCLDDKKEGNYQLRMKANDGRIMHLLTSVRPIVKDGNVVYFQYQALDMIDQKVHEQNLLQAASAETLAQLVGGIAHDFNNLLTAINGYAQMLKIAIDEGHPFYKKISQICQAGNKASILTQKILEFSRKQKSKPKAIDINEELSNQEAVLNHVIEENIQLTCHKKDKLDKIKIDPTQFAKVILNLILNAKDAMPKGGEISITTGEVFIDESNIKKYPGISFGKNVFISVKDTGEGMSEEVKKHIFEPFFSTQESGKGIGLWTVNSIVKNVGGTVLVESKMGSGTIFTVLFPISTDEPGIPEQKTEETSTPVVAEKKTILVVEDDDTVRELVSDILKQQGHTILTARNGGDALQMARNYESTIDLLITDIVMRRIDGKMLSDRMKSIWPNIKVMYMSGYGEDVIKQGEFKEIEFLQKPFLPSDLLHRVGKILRNV